MTPIALGGFTVIEVGDGHHGLPCITVKSADGPLCALAATHEQARAASALLYQVVELHLVPTGPLHPEEIVGPQGEGAA